MKTTPTGALMHQAQTRHAPNRCRERAISAFHQIPQQIRSHRQLGMRRRLGRNHALDLAVAEVVTAP
jgi:hypothetical protein